MIGHFLGGLTASDVKERMTWPDLQALIEHWKYEPPLPWIVARYFEIEERDREPEVEMDSKDAEATFNAMFAAMKHSSKVV